MAWVVFDGVGVMLCVATTVVEGDGVEDKRVEETWGSKIEKHEMISLRNSCIPYLLQEELWSRTIHHLQESYTVYSGHKNSLV